MSKYSFCDGAVEMVLNCNGEYDIMVDGSPLSNEGYTAAQLRNPYIAQTRYVSAINIFMRARIKKYLSETGQNTVCGCSVLMPCKECKQKGINKNVESHCDESLKLNLRRIEDNDNS